MDSHQYSNDEDLQIDLNKLSPNLRNFRSKILVFLICLIDSIN